MIERSHLYDLVSVQPRMLSELANFGRQSGNDVEITGMCDDSRLIRPHEAFLSLSTSVEEADRYILDAKKAGATAVVAIDQVATAGLPLLLLPDMDAVGRMLRRWFGTDESAVSLIGVTGTDGKSSVTWMLREAIARLFGSAWSVGTLGWMRKEGDIAPLANTTPSLLILHQILAAAHRQKVAALVCEVSSHGIEQQRIAGLDFNAAIWTNLGHDHLQDHGGFTVYAELKAGFVAAVEAAGGVTVCNHDDDIVAQWVGDRAVWYGSAESDESLQLCWEQKLPTSVALHVGGVDVVVHDIPTGGFHAENLAASALTIQSLWHVNTEQLPELFSRISVPPGRLEPVVSRPWRLFVDFAHTPEGLQRVLVETKKLTERRLLLLFGCGGDRDREKRPKMGYIASTHADMVWITSDNPRSESPEKILADIQQGVALASHAIIYLQPDRRKAIHAAVKELAVGDTLLVAGKGHESYMEFADHRMAWSDVDIAREALCSKPEPQQVQTCV